MRVADIRLQRADPGYATRAGSNNAHFLLARPRVDFTARDYIEATLRPGSEINAVGVSGRYHLSALQKATRLAQEKLAPEERSALARAMLADEAFALHFLEDVYASGHVAGTWGDVSQRKGTHDYYNASGLEVRTWQGGAKTIVLMGDAHMRPEDAERAAAGGAPEPRAVARHGDRPFAQGQSSVRAGGSAEPEAFDVCKNNKLGQGAEDREPTPEAVQLGVEVVLLTPVPSLGEGLGAMPRFRAEVGPFIGAGWFTRPALSGRWLHGPGKWRRRRWRGGPVAAFRIRARRRDRRRGRWARLFFAGLQRPYAFQQQVHREPGCAGKPTAFTTAIPGRTGLFGAIANAVLPDTRRSAAAVATVFHDRPRLIERMAVTAANGGLIPWQLGWATHSADFSLCWGARSARPSTD